MSVAIIPCFPDIIFLMLPSTQFVVNASAFDVLCNQIEASYLCSLAGLKGRFSAGNFKNSCQYFSNLLFYLIDMKIRNIFKCHDGGRNCLLISQVAFRTLRNVQILKNRVLSNHLFL